MKHLSHYRVYGRDLRELIEAATLQVTDPELADRLRGLVKALAAEETMERVVAPLIDAGDIEGARKALGAFEDLLGTSNSEVVLYQTLISLLGSDDAVG